MRILDGKKVAQHILADLALKIQDLKAKGIIPGLAIISVGDDQASKKFIAAKQRKAEALGIDIHLYEMLPTVKEAQLIGLITDLNATDHIHGIIIQLSLPKNLNTQKILSKIDLEKDIDGLNPKTQFPSATALGIIKLLEFYQIPIKNKKVIIMGKGRLVGLPLAKLLDEQGTQVENLERKNFNIDKIKRADILISATGQPNLISVKMIKKGAVVIDCGAPKPEVDFEAIKKIANAITPVPGGVGPVTVAVLMRKLVEAAKNSMK